jgi:lysophospholipase L1-like esterase
MEFKTLTITIKYLTLFILIFTTNLQAQERQQQHQKWITSFAFSPQGNEVLFAPFTVAPLNNQTIRNIVHLSLGGEKIRVRISNQFGDKPLAINAASVGVKATDANIVQGTLNTLFFGGQTSIIIPAGADVYSDPVQLSVENDSKLAINLFVQGESPTPTIDGVANQTSYLSIAGDATHNEVMPAYTDTRFGYFTTAVEVLSHKKTITIVTVGTSITDGYIANVNNANNYPSVLARRLQGTNKFKRSSVINAAISGNRLLTPAPQFGPSALERFERDVLAQTGVTHVIFEHGTNDLIHPTIKSWLHPNDPVMPVTAAQIIAGMQQIIIKAHNRGIKIIGGTILPFGAQTAEIENKRQAVNNWIRTSGAFDAVVDFDLVIRDPSDPQQLRSDLASDAIHPNEAGYQLMADSIDLNLFK